MTNAGPTEPTAADASAATDDATDPARKAMIDARLHALASVYGERWDEDQRAQIRAQLAREVSLAQHLRQTPLANADEPEIVFVPFRGED